jgi:hypothetical protein
MYKFGISYYIMSAFSRIPLSNVDIRLVRPGAGYASGIPLKESPQGSGYYETDKLLEPEWGFYEIWDDRANPSGGFSGKTCTVGKLDARGIQNNSIYTNHVENEAITSEKIAKNAIHSEHIDDCIFSLSKIACEIQDQTKGTGQPSTEMPPKPEDDIVEHTLDIVYGILPHIIITPYCDKSIYIKEIFLDGGTVKIVVARGQSFTPEEWKYSLLAISKE